MQLSASSVRVGNGLFSVNDSAVDIVVLLVGSVLRVPIFRGEGYCSGIVKGSQCGSGCLRGKQEEEKEGNSKQVAFDSGQKQVGA
jgi:hypothetical protein